MRHSISANIFTLLAGATAAFQVALVAGAPWGSLTQGGQFTGVLPSGARVLAGLSAVLLLAFIHVVRARAGLHQPSRPPRYRRLIWIVVYCALGIAANAATSNAAERALWLPVVTLMLVTSLHVAWRRDEHAILGDA